MIESGVLYVSVNTKGQIIDYIDPSQWGQSIDDILVNARPVYRYIKVNASDKAYYDSIINDKTNIIDFNKMSILYGEPDLQDNFQVKDRMIMKTDVDLKTTIGLTNIIKQIPVIDKLLISSGSYTVGSGGDYATFASAFADLADLTGDLTLTQVSDVTETTTAYSYINTSSYTITVTSDTPHYGDVNIGHVVYINHINHWLWLTFAGTGPVEVNNVHVKRIKAVTNTLVACFTCNHSANIHDIIYDGNGMGGGFFRTNDVSTIYNIYNCAIWDATYGITIDTADGNYNSIYENLSIYNCATGLILYANPGRFNNIAAVNNTVDYYMINGASGYNNASSDSTAADGNWATGSNNLTSINPTGEFLSLDDTDTDYLRLHNTGVIYNAGTTVSISGNTNGIRQFGQSTTRTGSTPSIGADEYKPKVTSGNYSIGTSGYDYGSLYQAVYDVADILDGDIKHTIYTDMIVSANMVASFDLNGNDWEITSDSFALGDPTNKARLLSSCLASNLPCLQFLNTSSIAGANIIINYLYGTQTCNDGGSYFLYNSVTDTNINLILHDNMWDGGGFTRGFIRLQEQPNDIIMYNNIIWNLGSSINAVQQSRNASAGTYYENNTFYNCSGAAWYVGGTTITGTLKNNLFLNCGTDIFNPSGIVGYNNATTNASFYFVSGVNNVTSIDTNIELITLDDSSTNFLRISDEGVLKDSGAAPDYLYNTYGIRGNVRPHNSNYSIGADEFAIVSGFNVPVETITISNGDTLSTSLYTETYDKITFLIPNISSYTSVASTSISYYISDDNITFKPVIMKSGSGIGSIYYSTSGRIWLTLDVPFPYLKVKLNDAVNKDMSITCIKLRNTRKLIK